MSMLLRAGNGGRDARPKQHMDEIGGGAVASSGRGTSIMVIF